VTEIRPIAGDDELAAALALRERVFCAEQGVSLEGDRDGLDDGALHLIALEDGNIVGTCRLLFDGDVARFQRLCVAPEARRHGLGAALLAEAERAARAAHVARMDLHAQTAALALYEQAGYTAYGVPFDDEGIEHLAMEKRLA
jgi:predicted GNAT family N-acyltransferase